MALDRSLIKQLRTLDEYDLRRLIIFARGLLVQKGAEGLGDSPRDSATEQSTQGQVSYRLEPVSCGKPGCTRCPHGPYWYAYWRESGRVRSRYIGKHLPADAKKPD